MYLESVGTRVITAEGLRSSEPQHQRLSTRKYILILDEMHRPRRNSVTDLSPGQRVTSRGVCCNSRSLVSSVGYCLGNIGDLRSFEIRFVSKVIGRFVNFRVCRGSRACPMIVLVKRLKPLTALSGTVYRLASSMSDHTPVLFNVFEDWNK